MTDAPARRKSRLQAVGLLVAAFAAGAIVGGAAVAGASRAERPAGRGPGAYLERLTDELRLTPIQQDSVRVILDRHAPAFDSLWGTVRPRYETLRQSIRGEIRTQLTPEQERRYEDMLARQERERQAWRERHGSR